MHVPLRFPVVSQLSGDAGEMLVVREDHTALAEAAEILRGVERHTSHITKGPRGPTVVGRTDCLSCVFDYGQVMPGGDGVDGVHLGALAEKMHGDDRPGSVRNRRLDLVRVHVERARIDIHEDGLGSKPRY